MSNSLNESILKILGGEKLQLGRQHVSQVEKIRIAETQQNKKERDFILCLHL
jgi:hypothetical protein